VAPREGLAYRDALAYLYSFTDVERVPGLAPAAGFDLAKVHRFFDLLGRPETAYHSILVAGTKGKGSTANYLAGALRAAGYRVGLYTQPHLTSFRERMQVDGALLPEDRLGPLVESIRPVVERMHVEAPEYGPLTTYEIATGLALRYFAEAQVEYAVLEIGLGGRLDAVNAVRAPLVSVITSLSLDHTRVLGDTIDKIAYEKAGIIKPGIPVVTAPQPPDALRVIVDTARERGAPLYQVGADITLLESQEPDTLPCTEEQYGTARRSSQPVMLQLGPRLRDPDEAATMHLDLPLLGRHQAVNAAVAYAASRLLARAGAARLTPEAVARGFGQVEWPGRLEVVGERPLLVLDGAHNGDSAAQLAAAFPANFCYRDLVLVLGVTADKDLSGILRPLLPLAAHVVLTQSHHPRAVAVATLAAQAASVRDQRGGPGAFHEAPDAAAALALARRLAQPGAAILVTGSLFVVGDARAALGLGAPVDEVSGDFFYRLDKSTDRGAAPQP
jgi:dihydrofolate synthase/folylpolyglutamate synthase